MELDLDKMTYSISCFPELNSIKYFNQINIFENIQLDDRRYKIGKVENTMPTVEIQLAKISNKKIIETMQGVSLEGEYLSGKKLFIVGSLSMNLILNYQQIGKNRVKNVEKNNILSMDIPFSTSIVIPNDICENDKVNLRYLVEDISVICITQSKLLVSITMLIQYLDEY